MAVSSQAGRPGLSPWALGSEEVAGGRVGPKRKAGSDGAEALHMVNWEVWLMLQGNRINRI